jgi:CheY-like chemotaxis protein
MASILWVDNDKFFLDPFCIALRARHHTVTLAPTLTQMEQCLEEHKYDALILDAMIPTINDFEERLYPPNDTDSGNKTGLAVYRRWRNHLLASGTVVFVWTVLLDVQLRDQFIAAGLPDGCYGNKYTYGLPEKLVPKIESLILHEITNHES